MQPVAIDINRMYKKRPGTSGISGQLYETKLLSLINFRAKYDDDIEQFCLATNVDQIGAFDDICFRAKVNSFHKPVNVFIQAKHKENGKDHDLATYFDSYLKIKRAFEQSDEDLLFEGNFNETECLFIVYTKDDLHNNSIKSSFATKLNDLIGTDDNGTYKQPNYKNSDVEFLCETILKEQIMTLAERFAKFLCEDVDFEALINDELVSCYHVIIANKVVDVSTIHFGGHRNVSFRRDFFETDDKFLMLFRATLYKEILKKRKYEKDELNILLETFLSEPSDITVLEKLIESVIMYKNGKFKFVIDVSEDLQQRLDRVFVPQSTVNEAIDQAARKILESQTFKVPAAFGNKDLTLKGNHAEIEQWLMYLGTEIIDLIKKTTPNIIVTIDESLGDELLQVGRGLAGAVGNVFVLDENTKLLKFADSSQSLGVFSKWLHEYLQCAVRNFHDYRFVVKVKTFPKLSFETGESDNNIVKDFLSKLLFYTDQSDEWRIGEILKNEIEDHPHGVTNIFKIQSDAIFLEYHNEIQKWWMTPKEAPYLTKGNELFIKASRNIINEPLLAVLNMLYKAKMQDFMYTFNQAAVNSLDLDAQCSSTIIVTTNITFTVAKLKQYYINKYYLLLELDYILNLPANDFNSLRTELNTTSKGKRLVFVCNDLLNTRSSKRIENISKMVTGNQIIFVTPQMSYDTITKYFRESKTVRDIKINLIDFSMESQKSVLESATVIFQGKEVSLDLLIDEETIELVKGDVFDKIIQNETVTIGEPISNYKNYEEIKNLYVDRRISRTRKTVRDTFENIKDVVLQTLYDLNDHVVLITAVPGMGKSILLTHLALKTKDLNPKAWIVRINLLEHSKEFNSWRQGKVVINSTRCFKLICQVALSEKSKETNEAYKMELQSVSGVLKVDSCPSNESFVFELKMFLNWYNKGELIFLFDGFDEIFPDYTYEALSLLNTIRNHPRRHRIWITSRSYNEIKAILEREFGTSYDIEHFSSIEQDNYLNKFWKTNIAFKELTEQQINRIYRFVNVLQDLYNNQLTRRDERVVDSRLHQKPYFKVLLSFLNYLNIEVTVSGMNIVSYIEQFTDNTAVASINYFVASPLHLYLIADYLLKEIKDTTSDRAVSININNIYKYFVETKMKKIAFQEINACPDNMVAYERERAKFIDKHKKLAAYVIFYPHKEGVFDQSEVKEIEETIETMKVGAEKTGFIDSVVNNMPIFTHKSFAEYFAVEYISDLLQGDISDGKRLIILGLAAGHHLLSLLDNRQQTDPLPDDIVKKNKKIVMVIFKTGILDLIFKGNSIPENLGESIALKYLK